MNERLESIEKAVENLLSINKDLIHLLEAKEQESNDLRVLLNSSKVYNEPSVSFPLNRLSAVWAVVSDFPAVKAASKSSSVLSANCTFRVDKTFQ